MTTREPQAGDEVDVIACLRVLYKYRKMAMVLVFAGMVGVGVPVLLSPPVYEASVTFFPLGAVSVMPMEGDIVQSGPDIQDMIISLLKSRKMADRIIGQLNLKEAWGKRLMTDARKALSDASTVSLEKNNIIKRYCVWWFWYAKGFTVF